MKSTNHVRKENQLNAGIFNKRNDMFIILSQQILSDSLLLTLISRYKGNFNCRFKLKLIIIYYRWFGVKVL